MTGFVVWFVDGSLPADCEIGWYYARRGDDTCYGPFPTEAAAQAAARAVWA